MERTYKALIEASHSQAVKSGWWEGGVEARSLDDQFNNFHAEVSEAWEEYRAGRMETWYSHYGVAVKEHDFARIDGKPCCNIAALHKTEPEWAPAKPEGFWVEVADLLIRLADTCGAYGIEPPDDEEKLGYGGVTQFVSFLHRQVNRLQVNWKELTKGDRYSRHVLADLLNECFNTARVMQVDLWAVIEEKMAYNATRSFRHGGKKA